MKTIKYLQSINLPIYNGNFTSVFTCKEYLYGITTTTMLKFRKINLNQHYVGSMPQTIISH